MRYFAQLDGFAVIAQRRALGQGQAHAIKSAKLFAHHRCTAAQNLWRVETTGRRQISPGAEQWLGELQCLPFAQFETAPRRQRLAVDQRPEISPGQRQQAVLFGHHRKPAQGDFDDRHIQSITQQPVGPPHRTPIRRAALRHAQMPHAKAPGVLQQAQRCAGFNRQSAHFSASNGVSSPPRLMNSA